MAILDRNSIPGYREAVEREQSAREQTFLGLTEFVCGVEVNPLTPRLFLILEEGESPFVCGGIPDHADVAQFFWIVSIDFVSGRGDLAKEFAKTRCPNIDFTSACVAIYAYIEAALQDSPGGSGGGRTEFASWVASLVHKIASRYHWSENDILNLPLKRAFQYTKLMRASDDPNAIMFNPSDRIVSKYLADLNAQRKESNGRG